MEEETNFPLNLDPDVFASEFYRWNELPPELKVNILRYLPLLTLRNFMLLSKECLSVASRVPTEVYEIHLSEKNYYLPQNRGCGKKSIVLEINEDYKVLFIDDVSNGCIVKKLVSEEDSIMLSNTRFQCKNRTCQSVAMSSLLNFTRNARIKKLYVVMRSMDEQLDQFFEEQPQKTVFTCKSLMISTYDVKLITKLLPLVTPGCGLRINAGSPLEPVKFHLDSAIFDSDLVQSAPFIYVSAQVGITNEQLVRLQATRIYLKVLEISSRGINQLILHWLDGKRTILSVMLREARGLDVDAILEGVDPSHRISETELLKNSIIKDKLDPVLYTGFRCGLQNKYGSLLVLDVSSEICDIFDPYLLNIPWS